MNSDGDDTNSSLISSELDSHSPDPTAATQTSFNITNSQAPHLIYHAASSSSAGNQPNGSPVDDCPAITGLQSTETVSSKLEPGPGHGPEGSSDTIIGSGDSIVANDESQEWLREGDHELKRVKVCSSSSCPLPSVLGFQCFKVPPAFSILCSHYCLPAVFSDHP